MGGGGGGGGGKNPQVFKSSYCGHLHYGRLCYLRIATIFLVLLHVGLDTSCFEFFKHFEFF